LIAIEKTPTQWVARHVRTHGATRPPDRFSFASGQKKLKLLRLSADVIEISGRETACVRGRFSENVTKRYVDIWIEVEHDEAEMEGGGGGCSPITPNFLSQPPDSISGALSETWKHVRVILVVIMENMEIPRTAKPLMRTKTSHDNC
jgi:hypothetical protein